MRVRTTYLPPHLNSLPPGGRELRRVRRFRVVHETKPYQIPVSHYILSFGLCHPALCRACRDITEAPNECRARRERMQHKVYNKQYD